MIFPAGADDGPEQSARRFWRRRKKDKALFLGYEHHAIGFAVDLKDFSLRCHGEHRKELLSHEVSNFFR